MFEIRVICDPTDTDHITKTLEDTFTTGPVRQHPTRDGQRTRLYITADHRPEDEWPTPEEAYALAPSTISEIGWVAEESIGRPTFALLGREFWLRKAALLDRIALQNETEDTRSDASDVAQQAAARLIELDRATTAHDPRAYVRQQYAHWIKNQ
ncbi:hypothetical protein [Streptomyces sp. TRM49041]|uniref:hypothetical protein n=1 Tax=Streptomyces sp. TRM49041 TaxID=2603216 RepID=UPI0011EBBFA4|nr:hypothetical protein [Streptomyces sp. TRM49041]